MLMIDYVPCGIKSSAFIAERTFRPAGVGLIIRLPHDLGRRTENWRAIGKSDLSGLTIPLV